MGPAVSAAVSSETSCFSSRQQRSQLSQQPSAVGPAVSAAVSSGASCLSSRQQQDQLSQQPSAAGPAVSAAVSSGASCLSSRQQRDQLSQQPSAAGPAVSAAVSSGASCLSSRQQWDQLSQWPSAAESAVSAVGLAVSAVVSSGTSCLSSRQQWDQLPQQPSAAESAVSHGTSHTEDDSENNHHQSRSPHDTSNDTNTTGTTTGSNINLYYRNYMSAAHKVDERVLQDTISDCVRCTNPNDRINLRIYYKNKKTRELVMRNNTLSDGNKLKRSNVVYQFTCPHEDCRLHSASYIGSTTTTLTRRLTMHLREGSPKEHMHQNHDTLLTRTQLVNNTRIIAASDNPVRLRILEALHIREKTPAINKQITSSAVSLGLWGGGNMRV